MRERQPDMQRREARLGSRADQGEAEHDAGGERRQAVRPHGLEGVVAVRPGEQAEGEQQRQRAKARHRDIDIAGMRVARLAMMRHDERPRGQRHRLPGEQEGEGVVRHHDEVHRGEEGREKGQHALRFGLMPAVADAVEARGGAAEIDDRQEEGGERVDAEAGSEPGQAKRQRDSARRACRPVQQGRDGDAERRDADRERGAVGGASGHGPPAGGHAEHGDQEQRGHAPEFGEHRHRAYPPVPCCGGLGAAGELSGTGSLSRTPRPARSLAAPSPMSAPPAASRAPISFMRESKLPRMTSSLLSMRWMVGTDRPDRRRAPLVDGEERAGGPELRGSDHGASDDRCAGFPLLSSRFTFSDFNADL